MSFIKSILIWKKWNPPNRYKLPQRIIHLRPPLAYVERAFSFFWMFPDIEAVVQRCSVFLKISQSSQENTCEFCEISKNTFFYRTPLMGASVIKGQTSKKSKKSFFEILKINFFKIFSELVFSPDWLQYFLSKRNMFKVNYEDVFFL